MTSLFFYIQILKPSFLHTHTHTNPTQYVPPPPTLHDVIVPAVGELAVVGVASVIQSSQEDLVRIAVLQVDELPETSQETGVTVRTVLVRQDRHLVIRLQWKNKQTKTKFPITTCWLVLTFTAPYGCSVEGVKNKNKTHLQLQSITWNTPHLGFMILPVQARQTPLLSYECRTAASDPALSPLGRSAVGGEAFVKPLAWGHNRPRVAFRPRRAFIFTQK